MQKLSYAQEKTAVEVLKQDHEHILHFSLQEALPAGHSLALHRTLGTLSYMANEGEQPRLLAQQQFTSSEMSLLLPLLDAYPYYCPYEILFAHFYHTNVTEKVSRNPVSESLQGITYPNVSRKRSLPSCSMR